MRGFYFATLTLITKDGSYRPLVGLRRGSIWVTAIGSRKVEVRDELSHVHVLDRVWVFFKDPFLEFKGIIASTTVIVVHTDPVVPLPLV